MPANEVAVVVIGESLVDIISDPRQPEAIQVHPGGSPLNVAVGAARLGLQTSLVTHYADDRHGLVIDEHLRANGVQVINGGTAPTSTALADAGAGRCRRLHLLHHLGNRRRRPCRPSPPSKVPPTSTRDQSPLCSRRGTRPRLPSCEAAREHATVSYDPNCRPGISPDAAAARRQAELFVAASDVVKASDEDLRWLYPDRTPEETLEAWLALGPAVVALTRGAAGPVILSRNGRVEMAAEPITVADTVGAGDSFMAGLLSGLAQLGALGAGGRTRLNRLTRDELHALAAYANRAAAITCSRQGANPPRKDELGPMSAGLPTGNEAPARRQPAQARHRG